MRSGSASFVVGLVPMSKTVAKSLATDVRVHLEGGKMTHLADERPAGSLTGLTPDAAKAFHGLFMTSFIAFTVIAIVAHVLVWYWRPWFAA
jgi:light-harvesting complex 1 beta chain